MNSRQRFLACALVQQRIVLLYIQAFCLPRDVFCVYQETDLKRSQKKSNLQYFLPVGNSVYDRVYRTFGDLSRKLYPDIVPAYPTDVVNATFLEKIRDSVGASKVGAGAVFGQVRFFLGSQNDVRLGLNGRADEHFGEALW